MQPETPELLRAWALAHQKTGYVQALQVLELLREYETRGKAIERMTAQALELRRLVMELREYIIENFDVVRPQA